MTAGAGAGAAMHSGSEDARREAARLLGMARSERKAAASRANGAKSRGRRPLKPLPEFPCTCGRGESIEGHPTTCPRGRAIRRRQKAGVL